LDPQSLVDQLISLPDAVAQRAFLTQHASDLNDAFVAALKAKADAFLRLDLQRSLQTAALLCAIPEFTGNPCRGVMRGRVSSLRSFESDWVIKHVPNWRQ
jgi:hypothetical protein